MIKRKTISLLTLLFSLALTGCGGGGEETSSGQTSSGQASESGQSSSEGSSTTSDSSSQGEKVKSDTLYVKKVTKMTESFYRGMDISSLLSLEAGGTKFYDFDGNEADLLKVIAENGVNLARVRIWNDPFDSEGNGYGGGNCNIDTAIEIGKRATANGVGLLANFHYSDFWADPGRQTAPKAWKNMTVDQKADALYEYTYNSLTKLKNNGVDVPMVQVGNETNNFYMAGESGIENFAKLANKGYDAVKAVYPNALVALHFTNPEKKGYQNTANLLEEHKVNYDVFGSSYYPFFHGTLANLRKQLKFPMDLGKKVMVLETQYAYTDEDTDQCGNQFTSLSNYPHDYPVSIAGQANEFRDVCNAIANLDNGIGVCYWEGAWVTASPQADGETNVDHWTRLEDMWGRYGSGWASKYAAEYDREAPTVNSAGTVVDNMAFFNQYGHPVESLKVYALMKDGNTDVPIYLDGVNPAEVSFRMDEEIVLPREVDGIYNSNESRKVPVTWEETDFDALKEQGPATYFINGYVDDNGRKFPTTCSLILTVANNLKNSSFEDGKDGSWTLTNLSDDPFISGSYYALITKENSNNPVTGEWDVHGYVESKRLHFKVEQEVGEFANEMNLNLRYALTGGSNTKKFSGLDDFNTSCTVYSYVLEDGVEVARGEGYFTEWGDIFNFDLAEPVHVTPGKSYTVGVYADLNFNGDVPGTWIDIDDFNFYQVV